MTDRIREALSGKKVFIPFITSGDPDLETTEQLVYAMERAGADLIELGIPFSDPTAELWNRTLHKQDGGNRYGRTDSSRRTL